MLRNTLQERLESRPVPADIHRAQSSHCSRLKPLLHESEPGNELSGHKQQTPAPGRGLLFVAEGKAYSSLSLAIMSAIFAFHTCGPVMWTDSPLVSTATVTGMSFTSNS